jgi:hypothetical protein
VVRLYPEDEMGEVSDAQSVELAGVDMQKVSEIAEMAITEFLYVPA